MKSYLTASFVGIIVAICGNVVISFALNCQKLAHRQVEERRKDFEQQNSNGCASDPSQYSGPDSRRGSVDHSQSPSRSRSRNNTSSTTTSEAQPLLFKPNYPNRSYTDPTPAAHSPTIHFAIPVQPLSGPVSPSPQRRRQSQTGSVISKVSTKSSNTNGSVVTGIPEDPEAEERWRGGDRDRESSDGTIRPTDPEGSSKPSPGRPSRFNGGAEETEYLKSRLW